MDEHKAIFSFLNTPTVWKISTVVLAGIILVGQFLPISIHKRGTAPEDSDPISLVAKAHADEIYPEFTCPCCDTPLNKKEICCGAMESMIRYIDAKVDEGLSHEEIMMETAKEFGMDRFTDEAVAQEFKNTLIEQAPEDAPKIAITEDTKDMGEVSQNDGTIHTDFTIKNEGLSELVITKMDSSCGCTSAAIIYDGEEGPRFGMSGHGFDNPTDWKVAISAGETATVRIYYDPTMHPDLTGAVTRTVALYSNDPVEFQRTVTITLEQVK